MRSIYWLRVRQSVLSLQNVRSTLKNIKRQWETVHRSRTTPKCFHGIFQVTQLWWRCLFKILTFDSFPGPLLPETLAIRDIPLSQIRRITVSLSGKAIKIAFFSLKSLNHCFFILREHLFRRFGIWVRDWKLSTLRNNLLVTIFLKQTWLIRSLFLYFV